MPDRQRLMKAAAVAVALLMATMLAGCGGSSAPRAEPGSSTSSSPIADFNEADATFASKMVLHHQQAVQLASMAGYQAKTPAVKRLAASLGAAQEAEIEQMSVMLRGWGKEVPKQSHGHDEVIAGMMTQDELHDLGNAVGTSFDRLWLRSMIRHHQGAVALAKAEEKAGESSSAVALAKKVQVDRTQQVAAMLRQLRSISGT